MDRMERLVDKLPQDEIFLLGVALLAGLVLLYLLP